MCRNLSVLYLYDNALTTIPDLRRNGLITHLYLQNNCIERVDNLHSLHKLTKLLVESLSDLLGVGVVVVVYKT